MFKKKYFLLLSTLLLTALLGLSTTCYAFEPTETELKNFMHNYINNFYTGADFYKTLYNQRIDDMDLSGWENGIKGKQGTYLLYASDNGAQYVNFFYFCWRPNNNNYAYMTTYNGNRAISTHDTTIQFRNYFSLSQNQLTYDSLPLQIGNNFNYYYIDGPIYSDYNKTNIEYFGGTYYPNNTIFASQYVPTPSQYFTFLLSSELSTIGIDDGIVPYFNFNSNTANDYHLGMLGLAEYYDYAELFEYRYKFGQWKLNKITRINNIGPVEQNLISVDLPGRYFASNTLYSIQFNPDPDSGFDPYSQPFYMKDRNTVITNGALDTGQTFSGDYYNNYNNDTNTQEIIDNTNDNSQVDSILEETLSGDIESVSSQLGFTSFDNPFTTFLLFVVNGVYDILTERGNVVLTANYKNYLTFTLQSDDFITPNSTLKTFIRDMLICVYIYGNYKYFHYLITLLETARINKFMAEIGTDEFYDTDIM